MWNDLFNTLLERVELMMSAVHGRNLVTSRVSVGQGVPEKLQHRLDESRDEICLGIMALDDQAGLSLIELRKGVKEAIRLMRTEGCDEHFSSDGALNTMYSNLTEIATDCERLTQAANAMITLWEQTVMLSAEVAAREVQMAALNNRVEVAQKGHAQNRLLIQFLEQEGWFRKRPSGSHTSIRPAFEAHLDSLAEHLR